jgi:hypothetical protein
MAESLRQVLCFQVGHDRRDSSFDSGKCGNRPRGFGGFLHRRELDRLFERVEEVQNSYSDEGEGPTP